MFEYRFQQHKISLLLQYENLNQNREDLAHTPSIGGSEVASSNEQNSEDHDQLLRIVKDITSKGFVRNNYKKNLVDLSDVKISLKGKK